jgi:hypothetical protein
MVHKFSQIQQSLQNLCGNINGLNSKVQLFDDKLFLFVVENCPTGGETNIEQFMCDVIVHFRESVTGVENWVWRLFEKFDTHLKVAIYLLFASIPPSLLSARFKLRRILVLSSPSPLCGSEVGIPPDLSHFICNPNLGGKLCVLRPINCLFLPSYRNLSVFLCIFNIHYDIFYISELLGLFATNKFKNHFYILL